MIDEIRVRNLALIKDEALSPAPGLTVLTGETGAGKTALISACKLLCGERASTAAVREGSDELLVEGRFFSGEDEHVVTRRLGSDGRSRVSLNGSMATVGELQATIGPLVDLCGQHEHQKLLKISSHVEMLDDWAAESVEGAKDSYQNAYLEAEKAAVLLAEIQDAAKTSSAKLDEARFVLQRIDAVDPGENEYDDLLELLSKSEHAEALAQASEEAYRALSGEDAAIDELYKAISLLEGQSACDEKLGGFASNLREAVFMIEDVSRETRSYSDSIEFDEQALEAGQERMLALQGLLRAYGPRMEDVFAKRDEAATLISLVDDSAEQEARAQKALEEAEEALALAADALDEARCKEAPRFSAEVNEQLDKLEMDGASIICDIKRQARDRWTKESPSHIEFLFQPAEGMQARPLARIASGGEISRVMLALKVVLGNADKVETLIFDEVDAGVGGSTALALAKVLHSLSQSHQLIVVTHLAQVAVAGDRHYQVRKKEGSDDQVPETVIVPLDEEERVAEIARMLSGELTDASRKHAKEMLEKFSC